MNFQREAFPASLPPVGGRHRLRGALVWLAPRRRVLGWRVPRLVLFWTLVAFGVRAGAAVLIHLYSLSTGRGGFFPFPPPGTVGDDINYWNFACAIYNGNVAAYDANSYPTVLALFFHLVGGPNLLLGQLLNVVFGALSVALGVLLVRELTRGASAQVRRRAQGWAGALLTFYPSLLWYSTQLLKDPLLVLLGMSALYCQVLFLKRARPLPIFVWLLSMLGLMSLRPYAVAALIVGLTLFVFRFNRKWILPILLGFAVVPYALGLGWFGWGLASPMLMGERLASFRSEAYSGGGSSVGIAINYSNPFTFLMTYSYSFATAMFGPFPWQLRSAGQAIALPETLAIWLLCPMWLRGFWKMARGQTSRSQSGPRDATLFLFSLVLVAMIALFSDNIGANTRLRLLPWSAFFIYAAPRLARKKWKLF